MRREGSGSDYWHSRHNLRHREALIAIVAEIVRSRQAPNAAAVRKLAAPLTPAPDLERLAELALEDMHNLHAGNVSRYRLRLSECRAWRPMQQGGGA